MGKRNVRNGQLESLSFGLVELESALEVEEVVPSAFSHFPIGKIDYLIIVQKKKNNNDRYLSKPYIIDCKLLIIREKQFNVFSLPLDFRFFTIQFDSTYFRS